MQSLQFCKIARIWELRRHPTSRDVGVGVAAVTEASCLDEIQYTTADPVDVLLASVDKTLAVARNWTTRFASEDGNADVEIVVNTPLREHQHIYCARADSLWMAEDATRVICSASGRAFDPHSAIYIIDQMDTCYFAFESSKNLDQLSTILWVLGQDALTPVAETLDHYESFNGARRFAYIP